MGYGTLPLSSMISQSTAPTVGDNSEVQLNTKYVKYMLEYMEHEFNL